MALPSLFAHSMAPIIVGYMTAHYLSYFYEQGQSTLMQLSDPMVQGDNLLRFNATVTADSQVKEGQDAEVAVDTRALHFFDPDTGEGIYDGNGS